MRRVLALVVLAGALAGLLVTAARRPQPAALDASNSLFAEKVSPMCPVMPGFRPTSGPLCVTPGEAERIQAALGWYPALVKGETVLFLTRSSSGPRP